MKSLFTSFELLPDFHGNEAHHIESWIEYIKFDRRDLNHDGQVDEFDYELYLDSQVKDYEERHHVNY